MARRKLFPEEGPAALEARKVRSRVYEQLQVFFVFFF